MTQVEVIKTDEKIPPGAKDRPEPARPEQPGQVGPQQPQSEANQKAQRTPPMRRPLFRS